MVTLDRLSIASSVVTVVHSLDYESVTKVVHHGMDNSDFISTRTDDVFEQLSPHSTDTATQEHFRESSPQYSAIVDEGGYTGMHVNTTNTSTSVQACELSCIPALSSEYIKTKDGVFYDNQNPNMELPEVATVQCYDGNHLTINVSGACRNKAMQDYVDSDFSVSDPRYLLESAHNPEDFGGTEGETSSLHDLCGSLDIDEEFDNTPEGSCSPIERSLHTMSPVEENEEAIRHEVNNSPKYMTTNSECGYIEFPIVIRQDTPLHLSAGHEIHNQPSDVYAVTPDSYQHQCQIDTSADQYIDTHFLSDPELHSIRSDQLLRLSKHHGSVSTIDSGYVRTCDFT